MATQAYPVQGLEQIGRKQQAGAAERNLSLLAAQQRTRRGPVLEVLFVKHLDNARLVKAADPQRTREMRSFAVAMSFLFMLTMIYMWQHFKAIDYGYRIEAGKQERELLREESRQLALSEAQLCDPERIDRMAHQLGLSAPRPGQVIRPDTTSSENGGPVLAQVLSRGPLSDR